MNRNIVLYGFQFVMFALAQILLFRKLVLFDRAFCFVYVAFVLTLPVDTPPLFLMAVAFLLGFTIDVFYDSLGLHAMSLVALAYLRNYWLSAITPQGGYDAGAMPVLAANGLQWFLVYAIPLVFVHHLILFYVEAGGFSSFWFTMMKVTGSLFFTLTVIVLLQYLRRTR
jgi:hypothetical protein